MLGEFRVSIGVCCYNEEQNIGQLLASLVHETMLDEIIVIASGCTDNTVSIVKTFSQVHLLTQEKREGKASAVNLFLEASVGEILVLESADTLPLPNSLQRLVEPIVHHPNIGATGGRPRPLNITNTMTGYTVQLIWELHHLTSLKYPKIGEAIAFRRVFQKIPQETLVDDTCIDSIVRGQGYKVVYIPDAIFLNKGPQTLPDLIKQRRRVHLGHLRLKSELGFEISTLSPMRTFNLLLRNGYFLRSPIGTLFAVGLEAYCRHLAKKDFKHSVNTSGVWSISSTTKHLTSKEM